MVEALKTGKREFLQLLVVVLWSDTQTINSIFHDLSENWDLSQKLWLLLPSSLPESFKTYKPAKISNTQMTQNKIFEDYPEVKNLLAGVFPPPDCLLLVGQWETDNGSPTMRLISVYRPSRFGPLILRHWGIWYLSRKSFNVRTKVGHNVCIKESVGTNVEKSNANHVTGVRSDINVTDASNFEDENYSVNQNDTILNEEKNKIDFICREGDCCVDKAHCGCLRGGPKDLLAQRRNLRGARLVITATILIPHIHMEFRNKTPVITDGYFLRLWKLLEEIHNFTTHVIVPADGSTWGLKQKNGSWNGMVGLVERREVDAAINGFVMNVPRALVGEFTQTLFTFKAQVFLRSPEREAGVLGSELRAFEPTLWLTIGIIASVVAALFTTILRFSPSSPRRHLQPHAAMDAICNAFAIYCSQGQPPPLLCPSARLSTLVAYLSAVVLLASFSSQWVALSSVLRTRLLLRSWADLLQDGQIAITSLPGTAILDDVRASSDVMVSSVYERLMEPAMRKPPETPLDGLSTACDPSGRFGYYISLDVYAHNRRKLPCKLVGLPEATTVYALGSLYPRKSPYRRLLQRSLERIRGAGLMNYAQTHVWPDKKEVESSSLTTDDTTVIFHSVNLEEIQTLLAIVAVGLVGAGVLLMGEIAIQCVPVRSRQSGQSGQSARNITHNSDRSRSRMLRKCLQEQAKNRWSRVENRWTSVVRVSILKPFPESTNSIFW